MTRELIERIRQHNKIKYGSDNETRIIIATLKPKTKEGCDNSSNIKE